MTWQDPYGQYGQDPYGRQQGWQDPYATRPGYGYGPPGAPPPPASNGAAIAALVCNIAAALLCCIGIGWLPGIILASMALSRASRDPKSARRLTMWSWLCLAIAVVLTVAALAILWYIGYTHTNGAATRTYSMGTSALNAQ